jgi:hypothetical protein
MVRLKYGSNHAVGGDPQHVRDAFPEQYSSPAVRIDVAPGIVESGDAQARQVTGQ